MNEPDHTERETVTKISEISELANVSIEFLSFPDDVNILFI